jgi:hypothetical protein
VFSAWTDIPDEMQVALAMEAMRRAALVIAGQAETLSDEMESGSIADHGGPEALRLLATVIRTVGQDDFPTIGMAEPAPPLLWP